jgi:hypothetical protein
VIVIWELGRNPPPEIVTVVPTGSADGEIFIDVALEDPGVIVTEGGCSTRDHKPEFPLLTYIGFAPLNVAIAPYQVRSKGEVNETVPAEVTGSSSITGVAVFTLSAPVNALAMESKA